MSTLSKLPGIALHHHIATLLEELITSGRFAQGHRFPTEHALCEQYGVSRVTIRRALQALEDKGLLERRAGRGTHVKAAQVPAALPMKMDAFLSAMADRRARSTPVLKLFEVVPAPPDVAVALALAPAAPVLKVERLRVSAGLPILHSTVFLLEALGRRLRKKDFERKALTDILRAADVDYGRIELLSRATLADAWLAGLLQVPVGSALVDVLRIGYDAQQRPFEYQLMRGPSDRFHTHVTIGSAGEAAPRKAAAKSARGTKPAG